MLRKLLTLIFWGLVFSVSAQDLNTMLDEANTAFERMDYHQAYKKYSQYRSLKPLKNNESLRLGIAAFYTGNLEESIQQLAYIQQTDKSPNKEVYYFSGLAKMHSGKLKEAARHFKTLLAEYKLSDEERRVLYDYIRNCGYGLKASGIKSESITQNLGERINGPYDDYAPIFSPNYENIMYFSKTTSNNIGGRRNNKGLADDKGQYRADIFRSERINGLWYDPEPLSNLINTPKEDIILGFAQQGKIMYFYSGFTKLCGQILVDTFAENSSEKRLFPSIYQGPVYAEQCDADVLFNMEGTFLIFASNTLPGFGGYDLYYRIKTDSAWSKPINLGKEINTAYDERWPYLAKDGRTLYFASNNPTQSYGGYDIFKSTFIDKSLKFTTPSNLGLGINSVGNERDFRLNESGSAAFFASDRKRGQGGLDIYSTYFKRPQAEQKRFSTPPMFTDLIPHNTQTIGLYPKDSIMAMDSLITSELQALSIQQHIFVNANLPVFAGTNATILDNWAEILLSNPKTTLALIGHHAAVSSEFYAVDLFSSYDLAEKARNYLLQKGVRAEQIKVTAAGSRFPYGKKDNPLFLKLSNRVEAYFSTPDFIQIEYQEADEVFRLEDKAIATLFRDEQQGLTFRIEILVTDQLWNDVLMSQYETILLEKDALGKNHFLIGSFDDLSIAKSFQATLAAKNYNNTVIIPYFNGFRLDTADIYRILEKYPQLEEFIGK